MTAHTWWMTHRRLMALARQPWFLLITLIQPVIWLFLFGGLFRTIVELPGFGGGSYLTYLAPGVVIMSAMASNMWAGMGALEEIERGTLNRFLVTPVSRGAIMNANVAEQALTTALQSVIIVGLAAIGGAEFAGGGRGVLLLVVASVLLGTVFSALSNTVGMLVRQRESIIGLSTMLLLPLTFVSPAFMPRDLMPSWMRTISDANPVTWALKASRQVLSGSPDWASVAIQGGLLAALAIAMVLLSTRTFRSYQRTV